MVALRALSGAAFWVVATAARDCRTMVAAFYSYGGWWDVSKIGGEVKDPAHTLPRALSLGVMAVVAAYVLVSGVFIYLVPPESVTSDHTFVAQAGAVLFGRAGANLLAGAVVLCVVGGMQQ